MWKEERRERETNEMNGKTKVRKGKRERVKRRI